MFEVSDLAVQFSDTNTSLFTDVSFTLYQGNLLWVSGPNGSGKSSLLYAISNIIPQHISALRSGNIRLNDENTDNLPLPQFIPRLNLALQNPEWQILFPTVEEELIFALENMGLTDSDIEHRIRLSLQRFALSEYRKSNPCKLSTGFQKLLILSIIDAISPQIVLLDEPLSNLSDCNIKLVLSWLKELKSDGKIIIVAEHNEQMQHLCTNRLSFSSEGYLYE